MCDLKQKKRAVFNLLIGLGAGFLNGLFGGGGGMIALPLLKSEGLSQRRAAATSLGIIWPVSLLSLILLRLQNDAGPLPWSWLLTALPGSALGAFLLPRMQGKWLRRLFGLLLIASAVRLFFR